MMAQYAQEALAAVLADAAGGTAGNPQLPRSRYEQTHDSTRAGHRPNKTCLRCGAPYYAPPARYDQRRFCSAACRANADGYDLTPPAAAPPPKRGEPGFIGSLPEALALVEAQLEGAIGAGERGTLAIECQVLRALLHDQEASAGPRPAKRPAKRPATRAPKAAKPPKQTKPPKPRRLEITMAQRLEERLQRRKARWRVAPESRGSRPQASGYASRETA